jgi:hypothetical protein
LNDVLDDDFEEAFDTFVMVFLMAEDNSGFLLIEIGLWMMNLTCLPGTDGVPGVLSDDLRRFFFFDGAPTEGRTSAVSGRFPDGVCDGDVGDVG